MSTMDTVIRHWGKMLVKLSPQDIGRCRLPPSSVSFLEKVGLPEGKEIGRALELGIEFTPRAVGKIEKAGLCLVQVGFIDLDPGQLGICIGELLGEVYCVPIGDEVQGSMVLMNSSIEALLHFLVLCLQYRPQIEDLAHKIVNVPQRLSMPEKRQRNLALREQYENSVNALKAALVAIDSRAFEKDHFFWSTVFNDWLL